MFNNSRDPELSIVFFRFSVEVPLQLRGHLPRGYRDRRQERKGKERKMGRGGGSAAAWLVGMAVVVQWIILAEGSATYVVGDAQGWGFQVPYVRWAAGKPFRAGDTLVFNYVPGTHNVVPVNANGYRSCRASGGARALTSGRDRVTLGRGISYYICTFPGHCAAGMKIAIKAA